MPRNRVGMSKLELDTPALCLNLEAVEGNIARMAEFFRERPARLRPHSKTHKSPQLAQMQLAAGAIGITCAKLGEAEVLAQAGIKDILIANQIVGRVKIERLMGLAAYTDVMVAIDDPTNVAELNECALQYGVRPRVLIEVDTGMGRCGVQPGRPALELAQRAVGAPGLRFAGIMGYEGHTIFEPDPEERRVRTEASLRLLVDTAELIRAAGIPVEIVSGGGTGTYAITGSYPGITEVQAGSYITMDRQYREGVGIDFAYGLTIVSTVVSVPSSEHAECDAGLKTMTQDFGLPLVLDPPGWELTGLAEEHGHMRRVGGAPLRPGDKVEIVPNHGCTTINLHDEYHVLRDGVLAAVWPVAGRGRTD